MGNFLLAFGVARRGYVPEMWRDEMEYSRRADVGSSQLAAIAHLLTMPPGWYPRDQSAKAPTHVCVSIGWSARFLAAATLRKSPVLDLL